MPPQELPTSFRDLAWRSRVRTASTHCGPSHRIVSGIFYLLEDAFRVGEYVEFGQIRGTVESISLRFPRLRHHRGAVHTIPFGEIRGLTNLMQDAELGAR